MKQSEKDTEKLLIQQVEALGGMCRKYQSEGIRGVPDRICIMPHGLVYWVELKSEGDNPTPPQIREHARMRYLGHNVYIVDTKEKVNLLIEGIDDELHRVVSRTEKH